MNSVWQQFTLSQGSFQLWGPASVFYRLAGFLRNWRKGSVLLEWAEPLAALLIAGVFAIAPFTSTTMIGGVLLGCAAFWVLWLLCSDAVGGMTPIHLLVLLYWTIATLATAVSPVRTAALEGWSKLTLYLMLFALMSRVLRSPRLRSALILVYLLTALIVSVYGIRQWFFGADALATWVDVESSLKGTTRVYSFLGNPNLLAAYLLPACIFSGAAVFAWKGWMSKALAVLMVVLNSACLVLTFSRGGWIGFVAGGFALVLLMVQWWSVYLPRFWQKWAMPLVFLASAAFVLAAVMTVDALRDRVLSIFAGREDSSNNFRLNVWAAVQDMIRDRPILGIGPGNDAFNKVYPRFQRTGFTALSAYSVILEIAVETGLVGLSCFLWLLLVTFTRGWERLQQLRQSTNREGFWLMAAIASMIGMLAHGLVDTVWYRPQVSTIWWFLVAMVASYYGTRTPQATSHQ